MPTPESTPSPSWIRRFATAVLLQVLALAIFVGFPALFTAIAPVSWVRFDRHGGSVSCTAYTCLLLVVPYSTAHVQGVIGLGDRVTGGTVNRYRRPGRDRLVQSENEGFLVVEGENESAEIQVSPASLEAVIERAQAFLNDPSAQELSLFVVANWKFSIIGGGLVSLLAVFYGVAVVGGLLAKTLQIVRWAWSEPTDTGSSGFPAQP